MKPAPKIPLPAWAASQWDPPPPRETLWRWARMGRIAPPPQKVGRQYYVDPQAKYVDRNGRAT